MKTLIFGLILFAVGLQSMTAQIKNQDETQYGLAVSQFTSQSGFQSGYEAHFTVQPSKKAKVGFGLFLDNETKKLSGLTITHQRMLMTNRRHRPLVQPFVFYNFIYRKTSIPQLKETTETSEVTNMATYTSLEHHLGMGININVSNNIIIDCGLAYGLYLGSIKHPSSPDPMTKEITGTNGSGLLFKTGIGLRF